MSSILDEEIVFKLQGRPEVIQRIQNIVATGVDEFRGLKVVFSFQYVRHRFRIYHSGVQRHR